jgi:hypothetical protein
MNRVAYGMLHERGISCITAVATQAAEDDLVVQALKPFHRKELRLGGGTDAKNASMWAMVEC